MEFKEIKTLTPSMISKLETAGITTVEALEILSFGELKEILKGVDEKQIHKVQEEIWKLTGYWFTPALKLRERAKNEIILTTGSKQLDLLLGGGLHSRVISEFSGPYAAGKTEVALSVLVRTLIQYLDATAIFLDTEETFREPRVTGICKALNFDADDILKRTIYSPVWHSQHFQVLVDQAHSIIKTRNVKLIIVDSIIATLRSEYAGRGELNERQNILKEIMRTLLNYARAYNLVVLMTNQVVAKPDSTSYFTHDPVELNVPAGGNIQAHGAETRVYLRKAGGSKRIARLIDSAWLPEGECVFKISLKGIEDLTEEEAKKVKKREPEQEAPSESETPFTNSVKAEKANTAVAGPVST